MISIFTTLGIHFGPLGPKIGLTGYILALEGPISALKKALGGLFKAFVRVLSPDYPLLGSEGGFTRGPTSSPCSTSNSPFGAKRRYY